MQFTAASNPPKINSKPSTESSAPAQRKQLYNASLKAQNTQALLNIVAHFTNEHFEEMSYKQKNN
jgi:hypothetical protein